MINLAEILKKSIITLGIIVPIIMNMIFWKNTPIGIFFTFLLFISFGSSLGNISPFKMYRPYWNVAFGILLFMSIIIILGSLFYYFLPYTAYTITIILIGVAIFLLFIPRIKNNLPLSTGNSIKTQYGILALIGIFLLLEFLNFYILAISATQDAIRSPWQAIPKEFFLFYFFSTLFLVAISLYNKKSHITLWLIILHFFLSLTIAVTIYKLGYGFDPIIHQTSEKIISETGSITPKQFYYTGQYVLVVFLSKITVLPTLAIDLYLIPVFFSLFIPLIVYFTFLQITQKVHFLPYLSLAFLAIPYSSFIITTPQALANFFILLLILLSAIIVFSDNTKWIWPLGIFALTTIFIHPLAGIPALLFMTFLGITYYLKSRSQAYSILRKFLYFEVGVLSSISLPLIFIVNSELSKTLTSLMSLAFLRDKKIIQETFQFFLPSIKNNFSLIYDLVYWYEANRYILFLVIAIFGIVLLIKKYAIKKILLYPALFIIFFINYALLRIIVQFPSLISYERTNYPNRIFELSFYFLVPIIFFTLIYSLAISFKKTKFLVATLILITSTFITSSLYLSYPRADKYHLDRGYNITQTDINTVRYIDDTAQGDYIVLANQMTSVAAIREFGFKKYYHNNNTNKDYFYYPIPTGDPLYQYYLDMVYINPNKSTAKLAGNFIGVKNVYFVLSSYWDKFEELTEKAKKDASSWQSIDQDKAFVFYYDLSK